jgi:hypothetical protein
MIVLFTLPCLLLVFNHPEQPFSVQWMFINAPATDMLKGLGFRF